MEAIAKCKATDYDLVIMDIMMPQLSGIEACKRLREESCVPVLFLTAKSSEIDKMQAFEVGGDDYLVKPFSKANSSSNKTCPSALTIISATLYIATFC